MDLVVTTQPSIPPTPLAVYSQNLKHLTGDLVEFLSHRDNSVRISPDNLRATYTQSGEYLMWCVEYHHTPDVAQFILDLTQRITPTQSIIDVGCASGFSGLSLVKLGYHNITFHDYAGLGLSFISWLAQRTGLPLKVIPYGEPAPRYDWVLCMDVLEHTGNHLGCLKWLEGLGDNVVLCYPLMEFNPPFVKVVDEWVDDEIIMTTISSRYRVLDTRVVDGRRYVVYGVK